MGLEERENKRKNSIVNSMIADSPESADKQNITDELSINIIAKPKKESRSKRLNLLITPSIHAEALKKCEKMGISLNECVNQFLENWTRA